MAAVGVIDRNKTGVEITFLGDYFYKCGVLRYEICENIKYMNEDGSVNEKKLEEREKHCQRGLLENVIAQ